MRKSTVLFYAIAFLTLANGCEENEIDIDNEIKGGFNITINDSILYNHNSIDFYDISSHLVYLKADNNFIFSTHGSFSVQVDSELIYTGQIIPGYSSYWPSGPIIQCAPTFYGEYIIPIGFFPSVDSTGRLKEDPRNDARIIEALKKNNQYKNGLSSEIHSIQKLSENKVQITIQLTNLDTGNILYLDPDRMGLELFHYFTNGLTIRDSQNKYYTHKLTIEKPDPWDLWDINWLSVLKSNETKIITVTYNDFDTLTPGEYTCWFNYPGLTSQIEKEELQQDSGRIWLGKLTNTKIINVE
ncbi:hypothetical protein [Saccharicrinis sp. FJH54]|uniref:hypothetical protein n=1 Tax=Saccharicrinis sp. FJH54 TaxID=3344665 RepID=UPI0035D49FDB